MNSADTPLVVILGMTASGKSQLAINLAQRYNGEIICCDSRTVYKGMDIGTAKPTTSDRNKVKHHLLDIISPSQTYTAAQFKKDAVSSINNIERQGKIPVMVGGTGLYIDGVIYDFAFLPPANSDERTVLETMNILDLQARLSDRGITLPENSSNKRHLIRAIETNGAIPVKKGLRNNTLIIGIDTTREVIIERINKRINSMIDMGLETEVKNLSEEFGWDSPGMSAVGYKEWRDYFGGTLSFEDVISSISKNTLQYARRQRTWFKRNVDINWVNDVDQANQMVKSFLQF